MTDSVIAGYLWGIFECLLIRSTSSVLVTTNALFSVKEHLDDGLSDSGKHNTSMMESQANFETFDGKSIKERRR